MTKFNYAHNFNKTLDNFSTKGVESLLISILETHGNIEKKISEHQKRVTIIAYYLAKQLNLNKKELNLLVFSSLIHDIGLISVDQKTKEIDRDFGEDNIHAKIAYRIWDSNSFKRVAKIIKYHHVDNNTYNSKGKNIPFESLLLSFANTVELIFKHNIVAVDQREKFDNFIKYKPYNYPYEFYSALSHLRDKSQFWFDLDTLTLREIFYWIDVNSLIDDHQSVLEDSSLIYSRIIDFRSKFYISHSYSVGNIAYLLAKTYGFHESECKEIKLVGYLHDIGKIIVPLEILNKCSSLKRGDYDRLKFSQYYTRKIINSIIGFEKIGSMINRYSEFEKIKTENENSIELQILLSSDVITALLEERPYRPAFKVDELEEVLKLEIKPNISKNLFNLIIDNLPEISKTKKKIHSDINRKLRYLY